jgi:hypothetical protein
MPRNKHTSTIRTSQVSGCDGCRNHYVCHGAGVDAGVGVFVCRWGDGVYFSTVVGTRLTHELHPNTMAKHAGAA